MSRIHLTIERLVLRGVGRRDAAALSDAMRAHLGDMLLDRTTRDEWARPRRTPVVKMGGIPLRAGDAGARAFGRRLAGAIGRGLKP